MNITRIIPVNNIGWACRNTKAFFTVIAFNYLKVVFMDTFKFEPGNRCRLF
jgi:hypothetical protein